MKRTMVILAAGVAALVLGAEAQQPQGPQPQRPAQQPQGLQARKPGATDRGRANRARRASGRDSRLGKDDRRLVESIEETESLSRLRGYVQRAMDSRSEEVRMAMVNALEGASRHSASDFACFLADPSKEVAEAAFAAWVSALEEDRGEDRIRSILDTADVLRRRPGGSRQMQDHGGLSRQEPAPGARPGR